MFSEAFHEQGLQGQAQNLCYLSLFFAFKTGGNAARFSKTFFGPFRSLKFLLWKLGPPWTRASRTGSEFLFFVFAFTSKQGEMLPVFQKTTFGVHLIFEFFLSKHLGPSDVFRGFPWTRASRTGSEFVLFVFVFALKQGEMLPVFQKTFFGPFRSLKFLLLKIGSSMNKGFKDRVRVLFFLCFYLKTGGNAARFSKKTFGSIRSLKCFL